jgi:hypothetical protein
LKEIKDLLNDIVLKINSNVLSKTIVEILSNFSIFLVNTIYKTIDNDKDWSLFLLELYLQDSLHCRLWVDSTETILLCKNIIYWTSISAIVPPIIQDSLQFQTPSEKSKINNKIESVGKGEEREMDDDYSSGEEEVLDEGSASKMTNCLSNPVSVLPFPSLDNIMTLNDPIDEAVEISTASNDSCNINSTSSLKSKSTITTVESNLVIDRFNHIRSEAENLVINTIKSRLENAVPGSSTVNAIQTICCFCGLQKIRILSSNYLEKWNSNPASSNIVKKVILIIVESIDNNGGILSEEMVIIRHILRLRTKMRVSQAELYKSVLTIAAHKGADFARLILNLLLYDEMAYGSPKLETIKLIYSLYISLISKPIKENKENDDDRIYKNLSNNNDNKSMKIETNDNLKINNSKSNNSSRFNSITSVNRDEISSINTKSGSHGINSSIQIDTNSRILGESIGEVCLAIAASSIGWTISNSRNLLDILSKLFKHIGPKDLNCSSYLKGFYYILSPMDMSHLSRVAGLKNDLFCFISDMILVMYMVIANDIVIIDKEKENTGSNALGSDVNISRLSSRGRGSGGVGVRSTTTTSSVNAGFRTISRASSNVKSSSSSFGNMNKTSNLSRESPPSGNISSSDDLIAMNNNSTNNTTVDNKKLRSKLMKEIVLISQSSIEWINDIATLTNESENDLKFNRNPDSQLPYVEWVHKILCLHFSSITKLNIEVNRGSPFFLRDNGLISITLLLKIIQIATNISCNVTNMTVWIDLIDTLLQKAIKTCSNNGNTKAIEDKINTEKNNIYAPIFIDFDEFGNENSVIIISKLFTLCQLTVELNNNKIYSINNARISNHSNFDDDGIVSNKSSRSNSMSTDDGISEVNKISKELIINDNNNLSSTKKIDNGSITSRLIPKELPSLADRSLYWKICTITMMIGCAYPSSFGKYLWNSVPTVQNLMLKTICRNFVNINYNKTNDKASINITSPLEENKDNSQFINNHCIYNTSKDISIMIRNNAVEIPFSEKNHSIYDIEEAIIELEEKTWEYLFNKVLPPPPLLSLPSISSVKENSDLEGSNTLLSASIKKQPRTSNNGKSNKNQLISPSDDNSIISIPTDSTCTSSLTSTTKTIVKKDLKEVSKRKRSSSIESENKVDKPLNKKNKDSKNKVSKEKIVDKIGDNDDNQLNESIENLNESVDDFNDLISMDLDIMDDLDKGTLFLPILNSTSPDPFTTQLGFVYKADMIFTSIKGIPRIVPDNILKIVKSFDSKYNLGGQLRSCVDPDFVYSTLIGNNNNITVNNNIMKIDKDNIERTANLILPAIRTDYESIVKRLPPVVLCHLLLIITQKIYKKFNKYCVYDDQDDDSLIYSKEILNNKKCINSSDNDTIPLFLSKKDVFNYLVTDAEFIADTMIISSFICKIQEILLNNDNNTLPLLEVSKKNCFDIVIILLNELRNNDKNRRNTAILTLSFLSTNESDLNKFSSIFISGVKCCDIASFLNKSYVFLKTNRFNENDNKDIFLLIITNIMKIIETENEPVIIYKLFQLLMDLEIKMGLNNNYATDSFLNVLSTRPIISYKIIPLMSNEMIYSLIKPVILCITQLDGKNIIFYDTYIVKNIPISCDYQYLTFNTLNNENACHLRIDCVRGLFRLLLLVENGNINDQSCWFGDIYNTIRFLIQRLSINDMKSHISDILASSKYILSQRNYFKICRCLQPEYILYLLSNNTIGFTSYVLLIFLEIINKKIENNNILSNYSDNWNNLIKDDDQGNVININKIKDQYTSFYKIISNPRLYESSNLLQNTQIFENLENNDKIIIPIDNGLLKILFP